MANDKTPEVLKKYHPGGYFGFDLDGRPVYIEPLGRIDFVGLLHSASVADILQYCRNRCMYGERLGKEQEEKLGKEFHRYTTVILDAEGGARKHLWRPGIQVSQRMVKMIEEDFPKLRQRILVVNAPFIFPIIYALLKPFLSQETKDKMIILGSTWKTDLLEYISADQLPEFYGGTCKDDNDNPKCEQYICYAGEIPKSYYVIENVSKDDFESDVLKAGRKLVIKRTVTVANSRIKYEFITSHHDIGFSVELEVDGDDDNIIIIPNARKASNIIMEQGEIECETVGNYLFVFDNSYSWIRGKELFHLIQLVK